MIPLRLRINTGLALVDILIVILIAGIIAAILIPQYVQKREKEQMELSRKNMIVLSEAEEAYFQATRTYTSSVQKLATVAPEVGKMVAPAGKEYTIELPDSQSYIIMCPLGHGEVWANSAGAKFSWEK